LSKADVDLIFTAGDIAILYFASLAGKCLTMPHFGGFGGLEPLKIVGRHPNPKISKRHILG